MDPLTNQPAFGAALTVAVYALFTLLYRRLTHPLVHPVFLSIVTLIVVLLAADIPFEDYDRGGSVVSFFLGPAVVALAVPLYRNRHEVRRHFLPIAAAVLVGAVTAVVVTLLLARLLDATDVTLRSLAPRSVTTAIAVGISEELAGIPSVTAGVVVLTGVLTAVVGVPFLVLIRVRHSIAVGLAMGTAGHGVGTARAMEESPLIGAVAGLAIGLHGLVASVLLPLLVPVLVS